MILSVHILFGAAVGSATGNPAFGVPVAFASHYMLDSLPHREYSIDNIENIFNGGWRKAAVDLAKVFFDILCGIAALFILSPTTNMLPLLLLYGIVACLPDALSFIYFLFPSNRLLNRHRVFHQEIIHIHQNKDETPWRLGIPFQIATALGAIMLLAQ